MGRPASLGYVVLDEDGDLCTEETFPTLRAAREWASVKRYVALRWTIAALRLVETVDSSAYVPPRKPDR